MERWIFLHFLQVRTGGFFSRIFRQVRICGYSRDFFFAFLGTSLTADFLIFLDRPGPVDFLGFLDMSGFVDILAILDRFGPVSFYAFLDRS